VLPGASFAEKAGTYENAKGLLQAFEQAIPVIEMAKSEGQLALDIAAVLDGRIAPIDKEIPVVIDTTRGQVAAGAQIATPYAEAFDAATIRARMAASGEALAVFGTGVSMPPSARETAAYMQPVEL
jgi:NADH dehydrogenase/NADH:ubiquinone oxidoreductase subunit G